MGFGKKIAFSDFGTDSENTPQKLNTGHLRKILSKDIFTFRKFIMGSRVGSLSDTSYCSLREQTEKKGKS